MQLLSPLEFRTYVRDKNGKFAQTSGKGAVSPVRINTGKTPRVMGEHHSLAHYTPAQQKVMVGHFNAATGLTYKTAEQVVAHLERNVNRQFEAAKALDPQLKTRHWYEAANDKAGEISEMVGGKTTGVGSALLAITSPQNPWDQNVKLATEIAKAHKSGVVSVDDAKAAYRDEANSAMHGVRKSLTEDQFVESVQGKRYGDTSFDPDMAGAIMSSSMKAAKHNSTDQRLITDKDGGYAGYEEVEGTKLGGKPSAMFANGLKLLRSHDAHGESPEFYQQLSSSLGAGSKVRSFYNNINTPASDKHVTIDTHAVAGAVGFPVGGSQPITKTVFTKGTTDLGVTQTYPLFQEAFNRVAVKHGVLPREVQSVTWVHQREVEWPDTSKSAYTKASDAKGPIVSHLQRQFAVTHRHGVEAGERYRDSVGSLLNQSKTAKSPKERREYAAKIKEIVAEAEGSLTPQRLESARKYSNAK